MKAASVKEFLPDQLCGLPDLEGRAMFDGFRLYNDGNFLGSWHRGRLYVKPYETCRGAYLEHGMATFQASAKQRLGYDSQVPWDAIKDAEELMAEARVAVVVTKHQL